jgi:cytochrome d ubiquinol oxidase subunit II
VVNKKNEPDLTIQNSSAPDETQLYLLIALIVGVLIVFPAMGYLYKTFKFNPEIPSKN